MNGSLLVPSKCSITSQYQFQFGSSIGHQSALEVRAGQMIDFIGYAETDM
jgi:hypothetical protein